MIVCKLEMWPGGSEAKAREIGRVLITNVGGTAQLGDYEVVIPKSAEYARRPGIWRRGEVKNFPRQRLGPQDLLLRALVACIGGRSRDDARLQGELGSDPDAEALS